MTAAPRTPVLTVLYHPMLRRIGDRVFLSELLEPGRDAKISRNAPPFTPPRQHRGVPLNEPHLSRKPFLLRRASDGRLVLDRDQWRARIAVNGVAVSGERPISPIELEIGVIIELAEHVALLLHLHEPVEEQSPGDLGLVGDSEAMVAVRESIRRVATLDDVTVLIRGETGSGKELVAQAIHALSARKDRELVSVNLGELPASVAAAELFGTARGAFTGAIPQKGYFRSAQGSTLFLDEIGEASGEIQSMLLRVLETRRVHALGTQRGEKVDVRIIAATDANLEQRIAQGAFREPLLHRLAGYEVHVPPLRERRDDIGRLMLHFLGLELAKHGAADLLEPRESASWLPMDIVLRFVRCRWRGNVRQLVNAVRKIVIAHRWDAVATVTPALERVLSESESAMAEGALVGSEDTSRAEHETRRPRSRPADLSDEDLREVLCEHRWEISAAAQALGMSRTTLYARIDESPTLHQVKDLDDDAIRACYERCGGDIEAMVDALEVSRSALMPRLKRLGLA